MIGTSGFNDFDTRQKFINSSFGQFLINCQVEQLNKITAGDKHSISNFFHTLLNYYNNLMFSDEKNFSTIEFTDLNTDINGKSTYAEHEQTDDKKSIIRIDERFLFLTDYINVSHLNKILFADNMMSSDWKMLLMGIISFLHEAEHHNQDILTDYIKSSKKNSKNAINEFSKNSIRATTTSCEVDLGIENDVPYELLKMLTNFTGISTFDFVKNHMTTNPVNDNDVFYEIEELADTIITFEYLESFYEIDARHTSYISTLKLLNLYLNHPSASNKTKEFLNKSIEFMSDKNNIINNIELMSISPIYFDFINEVREIDNNKLFKHISQYRYNYPNESNPRDYAKKDKLANKLAFFLVKKGFDSIKEFFEYVVTQNPCEFSFWVADIALRASEGFKPIQKEIQDTYYKYIKKVYSKNELKPEQISFLFLNTRQKQNLLSIFLENNQIDFACKIMEDLDFTSYTERQIEILKSIEDNLIEYCKKHNYHDVLITLAQLLGKLPKGFKEGFIK